MGSEPKVNILLSTYNGEKYLVSQLDSLLAQTYRNITIYVRDDGSRDGTRDILQRYAQKGSVVVLNDVEHKNLGYMESFWRLLRESGQADYYAFCDQDDIWLPTKVELGIKALERENAKLPLLYSSSFAYCDENMNLEGYPAPMKVPIQFKDVMFYTPAFGFTIIINKVLRDIALSAKCLKGIPHDGWCQKIAASMGKIVYDTAQTAKYRRHSETVTYVSSKKAKMISQWIKNDILGVGLSEFRFVLKRFYEEYADRLEESDLRYLCTFMENEITPSLYLKRLLTMKRFRPSLGGELALRFCFLLNR